jgi:hypothetical protein
MDRFVEIKTLDSCVYSCLRKDFLLNMVDSLPKLQFQRQLKASFNTTNYSVEVCKEL